MVVLETIELGKAVSAAGIGLLKLSSLGSSSTVSFLGDLHHQWHYPPLPISGGGHIHHGFSHPVPLPAPVPPLKFPGAHLDQHGDLINGPAAPPHDVDGLAPPASASSHAYAHHVGPIPTHHTSEHIEAPRLPETEGTVAGPVSTKPITPMPGPTYSPPTGQTDGPQPGQAAPDIGPAPPQAPALPMVGPGPLPAAPADARGSLETPSVPAVGAEGPATSDLSAAASSTPPPAQKMLGLEEAGPMHQDAVEGSTQPPELPVLEQGEGPVPQPVEAPMSKPPELSLVHDVKEGPTPVSVKPIISRAEKLGGPPHWPSPPEEPPPLRTADSLASTLALLVTRLPAAEALSELADDIRLEFVAGTSRESMFGSAMPATPSTMRNCLPSWF